ncbi:MAG: M1 family metallopeptidase [Anaerolineales bacterium]|nr:M1 family metallopeptidase [Anaerolineales bacterium]
MKNRLPCFFLLFLFLLSACSAPLTAPLPAATSPQEINPTSTAVTDVGSPMPEASSTPAARDVPLYQMDVFFDYTGHYASVRQTIIYPNTSGEVLTGLALAVVPNTWPDCFVLHELTVDDQAAVYGTSGQRMEISLAQPFAPGETVVLQMQYELFLPQAEMFTDPNDERPRIFGWMARQTNLVHWYPFIVPFEAGRGWILHDPFAYGEYLVYDVADFEVALRHADPANAPVIASSGAAEQAGEATVYRLEHGRTFALSASHEYLVSSQQVGEVTVFSYYFPFYEEAGQRVLQETAWALSLYSGRFGPYPHTTLSAIAGDFADGMEYSALYFLSRDFYRTYDGSPLNYLTIIAVHETAHQWWFELVGNDQALEPWLDESLCTYSERIYFETYYPGQAGWYWDYRIALYNPSGWLDAPVAATEGYELYRRAIYLNGATFLENLRLRIGEDAFFAFLADYASRYRFQRATTADFFAVLREHTSEDLNDLFSLYFQQPH